MSNGAIKQIFYKICRVYGASPSAFHSCPNNSFALVAGRYYKEAMSEPVIAQKSPFVQKVEPGTYFWCACGRSKGQPFCDGSHKGTGFAPLKMEITEAKTVAWCGCKHTKNATFCDGSHAKLA
jgi:CDGSH-type Zn-finger protein